MLVYVNGAFVPRNEARVSVFDSGFVLGDGIWEGLRLVQGQLISLEAHLDRLCEGASSIALDIGMTRAELTQRAARHAGKNGMTDGAHIRLMVTRGVKRTPNQDPRFVIGKATVVIVAEYKTPKPEAKARGLCALHLDLPHQRPRRVRPAPQLAQPPEPDPGADPGDPRRRRRSADARPARLRRQLQLDQLLHRARRRAVDLDRRLQFKGITQRNVIDAWRAAGGVARECDFTLAQVYSADEAFVTGTLGGVTPVTKVDGRPIGDGKPGPVTKEASDLYLRSVRALG